VWRPSWKIYGVLNGRSPSSAVFQTKTPIVFSGWYETRFYHYRFVAERFAAGHTTAPLELLKSQMQNPNYFEQIASNKKKQLGFVACPRHSGNKVSRQLDFMISSASTIQKNAFEQQQTHSDQP